VLKRSSERAVLIVFLKDLFQLVFLLRVNKTLDARAVVSIVYEAFLMYLGTNPRIEYRLKSSSETLKQPLVLSIEKASGQRIDFEIRQKDGTRHMTIRKAISDQPGSGPVIRLDEVVDVAWSISMDVLMRLLYRNELMRNNPKLTRKQVLALLADRDVRKAALKMYRLYRNCFGERKGS